MDELTFRRRIYADPHDSAEDIVETTKNDPAKTKFKADLIEFDEKLKVAMETPVPDNLAEKILLNQSLNVKKEKSKLKKFNFAIAASFVLMVAFTFNLFNASAKHTMLVEHAIAHLQSEMDHIPTNQHYSMSQLNAKLASFGGQLIENLGNIKFVSFCTFQGTRSLHIVMSDGDKEVTVFVLPKHSGLVAQGQFNNAKFDGQKLSSEQADLVIISSESSVTNEWKSRLNTAIKWQKA